MLAAATMLGAWANEIPHGEVFAKVFIDDRLMLSTNSQQLQHAFHTTQFWDSSFHFKTEAKTVAFGNNAEAGNLWWLDGYEVQRQKQIVYLGVPLPLKKTHLPLNSLSPFYNYVLLNKIARSRITHDNAVTIVARKIIPALSLYCRPTYYGAN